MTLYRFNSAFLFTGNDSPPTRKRNSACERKKSTTHHRVVLLSISETWRFATDEDVCAFSNISSRASEESAFENNLASVSL